MVEHKHCMQSLAFLILRMKSDIKQDFGNHSYLVRRDNLVLMVVLDYNFCNLLPSFTTIKISAIGSKLLWRCQEYWTLWTNILTLYVLYNIIYLVFILSNVPLRILMEMQETCHQVRTDTSRGEKVGMFGATVIMQSTFCSASSF